MNDEDCAGKIPCRPAIGEIEVYQNTLGDVVMKQDDVEGVQTVVGDGIDRVWLVVAKEKVDALCELLRKARDGGKAP